MAPPAASFQEVSLMSAARSRALWGCLAVVASLVVASAAGAPATPPADPGKVIILSTSDVIGKTSPCGCSTPRGGFARRAAYIDSMRAESARVLVVDNGGFFPLSTDTMYRRTAAFMMDAMQSIGTHAVGLSEKELVWGAGFLRGELRRSHLPVVCANLIEKATKKPLVEPYRIIKLGNARVGVFGLMGDKVELGRSQDSLKVEEPSAAARRTIAELRKKGATVVVLLSQLGKVESEDLVAAIPGVDAVIVGHGAPMIQKGRMIKNTVACYGGEQGQYIGRTVLTLDQAGKVTTGDNDVFMLGPQVGENPEMLKRVKAFENDFNERQRQADKERAAAAELQRGQNADHFLGAELCIRCHQDEGEQWKTTSHSVAWQTLIDVKKDATPDCIPCHVVGFQQAGGYQNQTDVPRLVHVQCENCHGMGTKYEAYATQREVTQETCIGCHHGENDPAFSWEKKLPMIAHSNRSGETLKNKKNKPAGTGVMGAHGSSN